MSFPFRAKRSFGVPVSAKTLSHIVAGDAARDRRDWVAAADAYREALAIAPSLAHIWVQLGHAEKEAGRREHGEAAYARALGADPRHHDASVHLSRLRRENGDLAGAARYMLGALRDDFDPVMAGEFQKILSHVAPRARADFHTLLSLRNVEDRPCDAPDRLLIDVTPWMRAKLDGASMSAPRRAQIELVETLAAQPDVQMCARVDGYADWLSIPPSLFGRIAARDAGEAARERSLAAIELDLVFRVPVAIRPGDRLVVFTAEGAVEDGLPLADARASGATVATIGANGDVPPDAVAGDPAGAIARLRAAAPPTATDESRTPVAYGVPLGFCTGGGGLHLRTGRGWLAPRIAASWSHPQGGELDIPLPAGCGPRVRIAMLLRGLRSHGCPYSIAFGNAPAIRGELAADALRWIATDLPVEHGEPLRILIKGEEVDLVGDPGAEYQPLASIGLVGLWLGDADDQTARASLVETVTFGPRHWA